MNVLLSLLAGVILGTVFALVRLPIPAPITFAGVVGVVGVWGGWQLVELVRGMS